MKKLSTKKALLFSALAMVLCVSMLVGTTFAWFTDTASTNVNKIQAGNLDVALEMYENGDWVSAEGKTLNFIKANASTESTTGSGDEATTSEDILWEPGCTYKLPELRITNKGNLALNYRVAVTGINGDAELNNVITWTFTYKTSDNNEVASTMLIPNDYVTLTISGHMLETAGNEYQNKSIDGVSITVYATQAAYEYDSNNNQYDKDATPSVWDGTSTETMTIGEDGVYHITNAAQFVDYMNSINKNDGKEYYNTVLDCDIDLGGYTYEVSGAAAAFSGSFDGQNHTVSNYVIVRNDTCSYTGLFSISSWAQDVRVTTFKNLTVKNGTVISAGPQVAAILPNVETLADATAAAVLENCHAVDCVVIGEKKVGAVAGYVCNNKTDGSCAPVVKDCSATNCDIYCSDDRNNQVTLFGYNNSGTFTNNTDKGGNTLNYNATVTTVSTAAALKTALTPNDQNTNLGTIILTNDITVSDWTAIGANYTSFVLNGNGHSIYGLTDALINAVGPNCNVTIKNLTLKNVNISLSQADGGDNATTGAFLRGVNCEGGNTKLTIDNCHVEGGSIYSYKFAGGFMGMIGGAEADTNDVVIKNSSIKNLAVSTTDSSAGGFVAHTYSKLTIKNCSVLGTSSVKCAEDRKNGDAKAGYLVGTVNNRTTTISGCTVDSSATLNNNNSAAPLNGGLVGRNYATLNVN